MNNKNRYNSEKILTNLDLRKVSREKTLCFDVMYVFGVHSLQFSMFSLSLPFCQEFPQFQCDVFLVLMCLAEFLLF